MLSFIAKYITEIKNSIIITRIWTSAIILYTVYKGYIIGWTSIMKPDVANPYNSWSARVAYVDKGMESLMHLNIVSICMATSIIVVPIILYYFMFKPKVILGSCRKHVIEKGRQVSDTTADHIGIYLTYTVLFVISIYTFIRIDTPNNYYASRYFLPIIVPAILILFGFLLQRVKATSLFIILFIIIIFGFNLKYDYLLYQEPVFQNRFNTVQSLVNIIPSESFVFLDVDTFSQRLLTLNLSYIGDLNVISIKDKDNLDSYLSLYSSQLGFDNAFVISTNLPEGLEYKKIEFFNDIHPWVIRYPNYINRNVINYYLYRKDFNINNNMFHSIIQLNKDKGKNIVINEGETAKSYVTIVNNSSTEWSKEEGVRIGVLWFLKDDEKKRIAEHRVDLPRNLKKGELIELELPLIPIGYDKKALPAGSYNVWIGLVWEDLTWFYQQGDDILKLEVDING